MANETPSRYCDLENSRLIGKVRIVKRDGSPLTDDSLVAPVNIYSAAMFERFDVFINQVKNLCNVVVVVCVYPLITIFTFAGANKRE